MQQLRSSARRALGSWVFVAWVLAGACAGQEDGGPCRERDAGCADVATATCYDMGFSEAREATTGMIACREGNRGADVLSQRVEPCAGRGGGPVRSPEQLCSSDDDCATGDTCGDNRFCQGPPTCEDDSGCDASLACVCASAYAVPGFNGGFGVIGENECVPSECRSEADCGGRPCGLSISGDSCGRQIDGLYCHTDDDECWLNTDCDAHHACRYNLDETRWRCVEVHLVLC